MDLTYTWNIENMKRNSIDGGVFHITFTVWAIDAEEKRVASIGSGIELTPNSDSDEFINYEDLTEDVVIGWVQNILGRERIESELENKWRTLYPSATGEELTEIYGTPWSSS